MEKKKVEKRFVIDLDESRHRRLKILAGAAGVSLRNMIGDIIDTHFKHHTPDENSLEALKKASSKKL